MVYLVRHAHAGSQKRWSGSDHDRPLSVRGQEQADGLLVTLGDHPVARILSSPTVRCQHTVLPLSHHRGVPIELASSLAVQAPVERLLELVLDASMAMAVLCGHGEQLRGLLRLLVGSVGFDGRLRLEKGAVWILDAGAGTVGAAHYVPRCGASAFLTCLDSRVARMLRIPPAPAKGKPAASSTTPSGLPQRSGPWSVSGFCC
jgi:phosphohistidine phosphatase SixA